MAHAPLRIPLGLILAFTCASAAVAIPDWRRDGRPGYASRAEAHAVARDFVAPGAPRHGKGFTIMRDPDGGFTPVFHDRKPHQGAGS